MRAMPRIPVASAVAVLGSAILLQAALTSLAQSVGGFAVFNTLLGEHMQVEGPPVTSTPTYGTPFPEGEFRCDRWTWYVPFHPDLPRSTAPPHLECPVGQSEITFSLALFVLNVVVTAIPLAFVAVRTSAWTPLLALPAFVASAFVVRPLVAIPERGGDSTGLTLYLLIVWIATITVTILLPYAWRLVRDRTIRPALP